MSISWSIGWQEISDERHRVYIERELGWELGQVGEHPLRGIRFRLVGSCNLYDDFIVMLEDDGSYGYVHLVWKPAAPSFKQLGNREAVNQFITRWNGRS